VITLALNVLADGTSPPPNFYHFALAPEDEARQVAQRLLAEGKRSGAALVPSGDWGKRVLGAFQAEFAAGGGQLLSQQTYPPGTTDYSSVIGDLIGFDDSRLRYRALVAAVGVPLEFTPRKRDAIGFLFLAGQPVQGRLIRPQLKYHYAGELPIYSISDMYEPSPTANQDLDGLVFCDMPWMLAEDAATMAAREDAQQLWSEATRRRSRLFAFGSDAYRLLEELKSPATFRDSVAGLTGRLGLDASGGIQRRLDWAQIQADGTVRGLPDAAP
jgi:outer membrane PBP1 activator LpoA protein